jgi:hypothetical protein
MRRKQPRYLVCKIWIKNFKRILHYYHRMLMLDEWKNKNKSKDEKTFASDVDKVPFPLNRIFSFFILYRHIAVITHMQSHAIFMVKQKKTYLNTLFSINSHFIYIFSYSLSDDVVVIIISSFLLLFLIMQLTFSNSLNVFYGYVDVNVDTVKLIAYHRCEWVRAWVGNFFI